MDNEFIITPLRNAYAAFGRTLQKESEMAGDLYEIFRAAVIQNFEFSFELCWKYMKKWIELYNVVRDKEVLTGKDIMRVAHKNGLIDDAAKWIEYIKSRNKTSHMYNEAIAEAVFEDAKRFYADFGKFLTELEKQL